MGQSTYLNLRYKRVLKVGQSIFYKWGNLYTEIDLYVESVFYIKKIDCPTYVSRERLREKYIEICRNM